MQERWQKSQRTTERNKHFCNAILDSGLVVSSSSNLASLKRSCSPSKSAEFELVGDASLARCSVSSRQA